MPFVIRNGIELNCMITYLYMREGCCGVLRFTAFLTLSYEFAP